MQDEVDAAPAIGARADFYEVDQSVDQLSRFAQRIGIARNDRCEVFDLASIVFDDSRMRDRDGNFGQVDLLGQKRFALFRKALGARLQLFRRDARDDRIGDPVFGLVDVGQLAIDIGAPGDQAAAFLGPCGAEFFKIGRDDFRMQKVALDRAPDPALQDGIGDRLAIAAHAGLAMIAAAPAVAACHDERTGALGASQLAGKEIFAAMPLGMIAADRVQSRLHLGPGRIIDDPQAGDGLADLVAGVIWA